MLDPAEVPVPDDDYVYIPLCEETRERRGVAHHARRLPAGGPGSGDVILDYDAEDHVVGLRLIGFKFRKQNPESHDVAVRRW